MASVNPVRHSEWCRCGWRTAVYFADRAQGGALYRCIRPGCGRLLTMPAPEPLRVMAATRAAVDALVAEMEQAAA